MCQGAITINGDIVSRNIAYYTMAHASKFVRPGSVRIASTNRGDKTVGIYEDEQRPGVFRTAIIENMEILSNVAFRTPGGKTVLIVVNDTYSANSFTIQWNGKYAGIRLNPGAVGTFVW
jgi:glucosylceramidase